MNSETPSHGHVLENEKESTGRLRAVTPALVTGFVMMIAVLIASGVLDILNTRSVQATTALVAHTYAVKGALQQLLTMLIDAETGARGFIITGETRYLEPYDIGRSAILPAVAQVRTLTADNGEQ